MEQKDHSRPSKASGDVWPVYGMAGGSGWSPEMLTETSLDSENWSPRARLQRWAGLETSGRNSPGKLFSFWTSIKSELSKS